MVALVLAVLPRVVRPYAAGVAALAVALGAYRVGNYLLSLLSSALFVRITLIIADSYLSVLPIPPIANNYHEQGVAGAAAILRSDSAALVSGLTPTNLVMTWFLSPFYLVFGNWPVAGRLGVALVSLLVGYITYQIAREVATHRLGLVAAAVTLFWPTILYRSITLQREILLTVLMLTLVLSGLRLLDRVSVPVLGVVGVSILLVGALRQENLVLAVAVLGAAAYLRNPWNPRYLVYALLIGVPVIGYIAVNFGAFTGYGQTISPTVVDAYAHGRAHGDAAYLTGLHYRSWLDVIVYAPIKTLYFLYTPFPWQVNRPVELIAGVSGWLLLAVTVVGKWGVSRLTDSPGKLGVVLSYLFTGVLTYSIIEMNYGAAVRRRIQFVPILLLLAVIGLAHVRFRSLPPLLQRE